MTENNFWERVSRAQVELKAPKGQTNTHIHYNYRSCEDILEAAKPVCAKNRLVLNLTDEVRQIGDRYYVVAKATLFDMDSERSVSSQSSAREDAPNSSMAPPQVTGASSSYARKYALGGLLNLDDTKDADTDEYAATLTDSPKGAVCEVCGKPVTPVVLHSGETWPVADMVEYSKRRYNGKILCGACMKVADKK